MRIELQRRNAHVAVERREGEAVDTIEKEGCTCRTEASGADEASATTSASIGDPQ